MPARRFRTIVCDPPWPYEKGWLWQRQVSRSREHYPTLTVEQICKLPVPEVAMKNGYLWLWCPTHHVNKGDHVKVCEAWGYRPVGQLVWVKTVKLSVARPRGVYRLVRAQPSATKARPILDLQEALRIGLGYYLRNAHETAILAVRGKNNKLKRRDMPSVIFAPPEGHSVKPTKFYSEVIRVCRGPWLDLFARNGHRDRWIEWGHGVGDPLGWGFKPEKW